MKNTKFITLLTILLVSMLTAAPKYEGKVDIRLLTARPIDAGLNDKGKNQWFGALLDAQVRFRLEVISSLHAPTFQEIAAAAPSFTSADAPDEGEYSAIAQKLGTNFVMYQKYEISNKDKVIHYYIEISTAKNRQVTATIEKDLSFDKFSASIDTCLLEMMKKMGITPNTETERYLQIPILSANYKNCKQFGELIYDDLFNTNRKSAVTARDYEKVVEKDPYMLLANYYCGLAYYQTMNYEKSAKYLKELLDLSPLHVELKLILAKSYRMSGLYEDALSVAIECERMRLTTAPYLLEKALSLDALGSHGMALTVYQQILSISPKEPISLLALAKQRNDESKPREAMAFADTLIKLDNSNGKAFFERARAFLALTQQDKALHDMEIAALLLPKEPIVQEWLADIYMRTQNFAKASEFYTKASNLRPEILELYMKTGRALDNAKKTDEAIALLTKIEPKYRGKPALTRQIGLLQFEVKNYSSARKYLESYVASGEKDGEALLKLGMIYADSKEYDNALQMFTFATPLVQNKSTCKLAAAKVYMKKNETKSAMSLLKEILGQDPIKDAYRTMADAYLVNNDTQNALSHYIKERELSGNDEYVQEQIARIQFESGRVALSKTEYDRLVKIAPSNANGYYYLTVIALRNNDVTGAETNLTMATGFGNGDARVFQLLGDGYASSGKFDKAIAMYQKSLVMDPKREETLLNLATAQINSDKDSDAAETYLTLYKVSSKYSNLLTQAGHAFKKLNKPERAKEAYSLFINKGHNDPSVNVGLASIIYKEKSYPRVVELLKPVSNTFINDNEVQLMLADAYCHVGQYTSAIPLAGLVRARQPLNSLAIELSAMCSEKTGDLAQATRTYKEFLALPPSPQHSNYAFHLGELFEKRNLTVDATQQYVENIKKYPEDFRNNERLGRLYMNAKQWELARQVLEPAVVSDKANPILYKMIAQSYSAINNKNSAADNYTRYLAKASNDSSAWKDLGTLYYDLKYYDKAIAPLTKATQLMPGNFDCLYKLGSSLVETNNLGKAISPLSRAHALSASNTTVLDLQSKCYRYIKDNGSLVSTLVAWSTVDKKKFDIRVELGSIYLKDQKINDAIKYLSEAAVIIPSEVKPHRLLAQAYEIQGKDTLRLYQLNAALQSAPRDWDCHWQLARYYLSKNNAKDAESYLRKTLELNPAQPRAHFEYGYILQDRGDLASAHTEFEQAVSGEPGNPMYLALYSYTLSIHGKTKDAINNITVALGKEPTNSKVHYWAGLVYKNAGQLDVARLTIKEALQYDPTSIICYDALGDIAMQGAQFNEAASNYFVAWEKAGYTEIRAMKLGKALIAQGKLIEAKDFLETVVIKNPSQSEALYRLAMIYSDLGDTKKVEKMAKSLELNKNIVYKQLVDGKLHETQNKLDAAMISYQVVMKVSADNVYAHEGFGRVFLKKGLFDSAVVHFSQAYAVDSLNMTIAMNIGQAYEGMGQADAALGAYGEVDKKYPDYPGVQAKMATLAIAQNDHRTAIRILNRGVQYHPKDADLYFMLGKEYEVSDQFEPAITSFQTAFKTSGGKHVESLRYIGNIYYTNLVNDKKAHEFFKKYVKAGGQNNEVNQTIRKLEGKQEGI